MSITRRVTPLVSLVSPVGRAGLQIVEQTRAPGTPNHPQSQSSIPIATQNFNQDFFSTIETQMTTESGAASRICITHCSLLYEKKTRDRGYSRYPLQADMQIGSQVPQKVQNLSWPAGRPDCSAEKWGRHDPTNSNLRIRAHLSQVQVALCSLTNANILDDSAQVETAHIQAMTV